MPQAPPSPAVDMMLMGAVKLQKGRNAIRLSNAQGWMPDIDYIELVPVVPTGVRATSQVEADDEPVFDLSGRPARPNTTLRIKHGRKILRR